MQYLPYGLWKGKISPDLAAQRGFLSCLKWDLHEDRDEVYFSGSQGGKSFLYKRESGGGLRLLNGTLKVGGGVGYGGGDFGVHDRKLVFCAGNQGLYLYTEDARVTRKITQDQLDVSTPVLSPNGHFAAYVTSDGEHDQIALLDLTEYTWPQIWIKGADFYMQPEWSPDGRWFAWAEWDHPNMPWSGSCVKIASVSKDGKILEVKKAAGGTENPASQPHFSPDGKKLAYIESSGDWEHLIVLDLASWERTTAIEGVDFALSVPAFSQGNCSYAWFADSQRIAYTKIRGTRQEVRTRDILTETDVRISPERLTSFEQIQVSHFGVIAAIAGGPLDSQQVVLMDGQHCETVYRLSDLPLSADWISVPREIEWQANGGETIYGLYYPPCNPNYGWQGAPPAIVQIHGGPTGQAGQVFSAEIAYFTSLGYAYVRVNYRGSSGYGRRYLESLNGHWGEYDTEDAVTAARYLAAEGLADGKRMLITGGSAGGYVVLNVLCQYPDVFAAGACLYGVSNLYGIAADTHKLELHYIDSLVGRLPEADEKYRAWSPLFHAEKIRVPLAVFQGNQDPVVPPAQAEELIRKLQAPHLFRLYEGEGHGFRQPAHIRDYLENLSAFLRDHLV